MHACVRVCVCVSACVHFQDETSLLNGFPASGDWSLRSFKSAGVLTMGTDVCLGDREPRLLRPRKTINNNIYNNDDSSSRDQNSASDKH